MATNHHQHGPLSGQRIRTVGDPNETITVTGQDGKTGASREISYTNCKVVGNGAFGVVVSARVVKIRSPTAPVEAGQPEEEERIAIKKVLQDPNYKNRELQIMRAVQHPNVVDLRAYFYSKGDKDEVYLNLVLECMPETLYAATRFYAKQKQSMPMVYVKVYMYQLMRALAYIHTLGICHRDIKPQNIIVDPASGMLKLIDFGSAKVITVGQPNVSYIASRYYRAPEAIFGATDYTVAIDIWAAGCTVAELMLGQPPFLGESGVDQLVEIIKVLGTPTKEEVKTMNPKYVDYKFPSIKAIPFSKVFRPRTPADAVDFTSKLLIYRPASRLTAIEALCHPFMDELRAEGGRLPNGQPLPPLFDFTPTELSARPDLIPQLVPEHAEADLRARGIDVDTFVPTPLRDLRISVD